MDMVAVGMSADQNLVARVVLSQLESGCVSSQRIYILTFREALYHVIEQNAVSFVVEIFRCHEIPVDSFRSAVDTCDELLTIEHGLLILHDIVHHRAHATLGLTSGVVCEVDNCHTITIAFAPRSDERQ